MTRTITLRRVHALNWYGYKDSIPFEGNVLLAGVTGSGKSVLMDVIQFVLVGDQRLVRFNQSATGERSERTLKGYCLGDTKQENDGINPYMRESAITYAALEFEWPGAKRSETWGLRVEFGSAADMQGKITPFFVPNGLHRGNFLDDSKRPLDYSTFKHLIESREGRIYTEGIDAYLRDMAQPAHLNFERSLLRSLLPTAMSFTFLRSFNDFCRQFILPADKLDVTDVAASYRTFLAYERELKELNDQYERLKEIRDIFASATDFRRQATLHRYLEAELSRIHAFELLAAEKRELATARQSFASESQRLGVLDALIPDMRMRSAQLKTAINAIPEGQLFNELTGQRARLERQIAALSATGSSVNDALAHRVRRARNWLALLHALPLELNPQAIATCDRALAAVEQAGVDNAGKTLAGLTEAARSLIAETKLAAKPAVESLSDVRRRLDVLRADVAALRLGKLPFPTRLLDALKSKLPPRGSELPAHHLRELCEVTDEFWRPAVEVAFTRKFAVVVAADQYDLAEEIYHGLTASELAGDKSRESLVNPTKALKMHREVRKGSLAEKISCSHPVAAALVSHFFGTLMCVERRQDLRDHEFAILSDGFMSRGAFVERPRFYDGHPFVGKRGLKQQLVWKETQLQQLDAEERKLQPIGDAVARLVGEFEETFELGADLRNDLERARHLPELRQELALLDQRLLAIDTGQFSQLASEATQLDSRVDEAVGEQRRLLQSPLKARVERLEHSVEALTQQLARLQEEFDRVRMASDVSMWLRELNDLRASILTMLPAKDAAARHCRGTYHETETGAAAAFEKLNGKRRELAIVYPKFQELPADVDNIDAHAKHMSKLEGSEIPNYQRKAERERGTWEELFRTQLLEKLHSALESVRDLLFLLNSSLKQHPIGTSRYQVHYRQNPDFRIYHDLVQANALARPGELFFASAEPRLRDAIEQFLTLLIEKADSADASRLLDYRQYYEYDMEVIEEDGRKTSVDRHSGKFSGGENQSPYFIAILASYLRAYRRYSSRRREPSIGLVPIDEAFSKLSGERIKDCMEAIKAFDLQGVFSMSTGNIPYAFEHCDSLIVVSQRERRVGKRLEIRNIPVSLLRTSEEARRIMGSVSEGGYAGSTNIA